MTALPPATASSTAGNDAAVTTPSAVTPPIELPTDASSYLFLGKIGQGAFASVWKAQIVTSSSTANSNSPAQSDQLQLEPQQQIQQQKYVAVKVLNLDHMDSDLQEIRMEVQLMRLSLHPNILTCHTAFLEQTQLWVVTPFMNKGSSVSCLLQARRALKRNHVLLQEQHHATGGDDNANASKKNNNLWRNGNENGSNHKKEHQLPQLMSLEPHILYILQQTLLGLQYIHNNGQIHRDIKGSNILLNGAGEVKIADFGVSGWLIPQNEKAKTFVGTPCWMAPEVMEQIHGYDYKADLWSLGITALELAKGYAPYAKYAPMKVLILTIQENPPSLDTYEYDEVDDMDETEEYPQEWSSSFQQIVSWLLQKNPAKRPTCDELLQSSLLSTAVSQHELQSQICTLVPDVGGVTGSSYQAQQQQLQRRRQGLNPLVEGENEEEKNVNACDVASIVPRGHDAVWISNSGTIPHHHHGHHGHSPHFNPREDQTDRAPGTTWVFADGSQVLASAASAGSNCGIDDVFTELDQFCGATGGENYKKEEATIMTTDTDSNTDIPAATEDTTLTTTTTSRTPPSKNGTMEDLMEEFKLKTEVAKAEEDDDLDNFLDEFEKTTAGENFQRPTT